MRKASERFLVGALWLLLPCGWACAQDSGGLAAAREAAADIRDSGAPAVRHGVQIIATRQGGRVGRRLIMGRIVEKGLEQEFRSEMNAVIRKELAAADGVRRWTRRKAPQPRPRLPDWEAVEALLKACRDFWTVSHPQRLMGRIAEEGLLRKFIKLSRPQTALLLVRVSCEDPSPWRRRVACLDAVKVCTGEAQKVAIRALIALADAETDPYEMKGIEDYYFVPLQLPHVSWEWRLEALAAAREHWPERAESYADRYAKKGLNEEGTREIAQAILANRRVFAEALTLLDATGMGGAVSVHIREKLRQKDVSPATRKWGELVLRTLAKNEPQ